MENSCTGADTDRNQFSVWFPPSTRYDDINCDFIQTLKDFLCYLEQDNSDISISECVIVGYCSYLIYGNIGFFFINVNNQFDSDVPSNISG